MKDVHKSICLFCMFLVAGCHKSKDKPTITAQELQGNWSYTTEQEDHAFILRGFRNNDGKLVFKFIQHFYDREPIFENYSIKNDQAEIVFRLIPYDQAKASKDRLKLILKKTNGNILQGQRFRPGKNQKILTWKKLNDYMNTKPFMGAWSHSFEVAGKERTHIPRCFKDDTGRPRFNFVRHYYSYEPVFTECSVANNQIEIKFKLATCERGRDSKHSLRSMLKSEDGALVGQLYESWREPVDVTLTPYQ